MSEQLKSPFDIASEWYLEDEIERAIQSGDSAQIGTWRAIPKDVKSVAFARWLTHQYRLAMAKGIQIGRNGQ